MKEKYTNFYYVKTKKIYTVEQDSNYINSRLFLTPRIDETLSFNASKEFISFASNGEFGQILNENISSAAKLFVTPISNYVYIEHFREFLDSLKKCYDKGLIIDAEHLLKLLIDLHDNKHLCIEEVKKWFEEIPSFLNSRYEEVPGVCCAKPVSLECIEKLLQESEYFRSYNPENAIDKIFFTDYSLELPGSFLSLSIK